jgi:farnesyl-diphosphate farnesyltransferase
MGACCHEVRMDLEKRVLKGVSRSFYLTLRLLPAPMRRGASLGYLLARTSDTLADTVAAPMEARLWCLSQFGRAVAEDGRAPRWPLAILNATSDPRERQLLELSGDLLDWLNASPKWEAELVREVVAIIISGQKLDLERFANGSQECPVALGNDEALDDYTWRVAGCVGEFWTKLGFTTLGEQFSRAPKEDLLRQGMAYGKGLQLVNILRDLRADLRAGRCYLPVRNPSDPVEIMASHRRWVAKASEWVKEGEIYAETLRSRRLRAATVLPSLLAQKTLAQLEEVSWERLGTRIRIPRSAVYQSLAKALF